MLEGLWYWGQVAFAALFCMAMTVVLVQRLRRDLLLLRGKGVTVEARVTGYADDSKGRRFPLFGFTDPDGVQHSVRGIRSSTTPPPLGTTRRLVYPPGRAEQAEELGWAVPLLIDFAALAAAVASGAFLAGLLTG